MGAESETTIDGTVERVAFHNADTTYTVAKVTTKEGEVTIVGKLMGVDEGMPLRLRGIHSRPDYEVAGAAAFDYVASRPDVDTGRVAAMGGSSPARCSTPRAATDSGLPRQR